MIQIYTDRSTRENLYCSKIWYSDDDDDYGNTCSYQWKRNGAVINGSENEKYDIKSWATYDYCETSEETTDMIKEMNISTSHHDIKDDRINENRIKCFTSELTINSVEEADLGDYECGVGYLADWGERKYIVNDARNITVFQFDPAYKLPKKVAYFEKGLNQGMISKVLMQCVVEGGPAYWLVKWHHNAEYRTMEKLDSEIWRCFNYRERSRNVSDITESFIFFEDICRFDVAKICCSADLEEQSTSNCMHTGKYLATGNQDSDLNYYSIWRFEKNRNYYMSVIIPTLTILFFAFASTLAFCRSDMCCECSLPCNKETPTQLSHTPNIQYAATVQAVPSQNAHPN